VRNFSLTVKIEELCDHSFSGATAAAAAAGQDGGERLSEYQIISLS
jgi:hypothetical protein